MVYHSLNHRHNDHLLRLSFFWVDFTTVWFMWLWKREDKMSFYVFFLMIWNFERRFTVLGDFKWLQIAYKVYVIYLQCLAVLLEYHPNSDIYRNHCILRYLDMKKMYERTLRIEWLNYSTPLISFRIINSNKLLVIWRCFEYHCFFYKHGVWRVIH